MLKQKLFCLLMSCTSLSMLQAQRIETLKDTLVMNNNLRYVSLNAQLKPGKTNVFFFTNENCKGCMNQTNLLEKYFTNNPVPTNMSFSIVFTGKVKDKSELAAFNSSDISFASIYIDTSETYSKFIRLGNNPIVFFVNDKGRILYTHNEADPLPAIKIKEVADGLFTGRINPEKLNFDAKWIPCNPDTATYFREYTWNNITKRYVLTDYFKNGKPQMKGQYSRLNPLVSEGAFSFYRNDGTLESTRYYQDDNFAGQWVYYDSSGKAFEWLQYKDAKLAGPYKIIYEDNTYLTGQFLEGVRTGTWRGYSADGKKLLEYTWIKGKMNGMFTGWNMEGRPYMKVNMKDDEVFFDSIPVLLYDNGQPIADVFGISSDKKSANIRYYSENGALTLSRTLLGGDRIKAIFYRETGLPIAEYELDLKKKVMDGTFILWYDSGKKRYEIKYSNNKVQAGSKVWYENGKLKEYYDPLDKKVKSYDESGNQIAYPEFSDLNTLINDAKWTKDRYELVVKGTEQFYDIIRSLIL